MFTVGEAECTFDQELQSQLAEGPSSVWSPVERTSTSASQASSLVTSHLALKADLANPWFAIPNSARTQPPSVADLASLSG